MHPLHEYILKQLAEKLKARKIVVWYELWLSKGFLVGEPFDHRTCKVTNVVHASYAAFFQKNGKFYEGDNMTVPEFKAFNVESLP